MAFVYIGVCIYIGICLYGCLYICVCLYLRLFVFIFAYISVCLYYYLFILQQREYMTAEEAKTIMYDKETWNQYKTVLLQRTVGGLHRNQNEKVL